MLRLRYVESLDMAIAVDLRVSVAEFLFLLVSLTGQIKLVWGPKSDGRRNVAACALEDCAARL